MVKILFKNLPDTTTPVNAENLNAIQTNTENAIAEVDTNIENATKTTLTTPSGKDQEISNCAGASGKLNIESGETYQAQYEGRNQFNNNATADQSAALASKIDTGIRMTMATTSSSSYFSVWVLKDLTNYVGKTVRAKAKFSIHGSSHAKYYIGLANSTGSSRTNMVETNITDREISFVVPELSDKPYLILALYANTSGNAQAGDYIDYTNVIVTIDNEDLSFEPFVGRSSFTFTKLSTRYSECWK